ncbi:MAG: hypothetical protein ACXVJD_04010 [Mucilaginibacter sp.]
MKMGDRTLNVRFAEEKPQSDSVQNVKKPFTHSTADLHDNRTTTPKPKRPRRPVYPVNLNHSVKSFAENSAGVNKEI